VYQLPMVEVIPFYFICPIISSVHFRGVRWAWHRSSMTAATRIWSVRAHGELTWLWWITSISRYIIELNGPCSIAVLTYQMIVTCSGPQKIAGRSQVHIFWPTPEPRIEKRDLCFTWALTKQVMCQQTI
jgi:hypothetical protein